MPSLSPEDVKASLTSDQFKLYNLIWNRFMASQMSDCIQKTTQAEISAKEYIFKASGYYVDFEGFTTLYVESKDTEEENPHSSLRLKRYACKVQGAQKESALHTAARKIHRGVVN